MWRIALVTQKGGSGKSTLAACLAVAAKQAGERVFLIDLDPLQSLGVWAKARQSLDIPVVSTPLGKLESVLHELEARGVTVAILDTPGGDNPAAEAAIDVAAFCIVPARPNAFDLAASKKTVKKLKRAKSDYAFVLNQCPPSQQSARIDQGVERLELLGALISPMITARVDYQEATSRVLGVTEVNPLGVAATEMRLLWNSLQGRLIKGAARGKKNASAA